ncbi:NAD-dependent epimerase/dehydratase family protein [Robertmurraya yapensis]|uniref:NAD-dependent epimerase/dehydratase family protein n=1 Tax=Bacillus yapensis TaxID=2492960 RepID=A0A3S0IMJ3_9BACI|nr:NAD-dependent epimerase/dehydratase family protein [Bacillus yapensis]RTR35773.1 NAD-dependent epimerase/dehydratase family protein [Bacillus yapensis]TKS98575.1 NAD-dependent epimerase/dehydratase family protein [Bacillus yapensis]
MKNILVLGGTRFFGRKLVDLLLEEGHNVTILTRGQSGNPFGDKVEHIIADRSDQTDFARKVEGRTFDIVYDNICFSPNEAYDFCELFNGKIGKLVLTSTLSVYGADGKEKYETDFDPYHYEIRLGNKEDFTYGEGKRQAEAVYFKYAQFPVVAVRIPIVLGEDDYSRRLHLHVERIAKGEPIGFVNMDAEMSFIQATEVAQFLKWAGITEIEGPFNATANGRISLANLIKMIEEATGKTARIALVGNDEIISPYAVPTSWYMSNENAANKGFQFTNLDDWLKPLVETIAKES